MRWQRKSCSSILRMRTCLKRSTSATSARVCSTSQSLRTVLAFSTSQAIHLCISRSSAVHFSESASTTASQPHGCASKSNTSKSYQFLGSIAMVSRMESMTTTRSSTNAWSPSSATYTTATSSFTARSNLIWRVQHLRLSPYSIEKTTEGVSIMSEIIRLSALARKYRYYYEGLKEGDIINNENNRQKADLYEPTEVCFCPAVEVVRKH